MGVWEQRVAESGAGEKAQSLRELVDLGGASSAEEQDYLDRVGRLADLAGWTIENVDPALIGLASLNQLSAALGETASLLERWRAGEGPELLTVQVVNSCDALSAALATVPVPSSTPEASVEIGSLRRSVGQHRGQVEREVEGVLAGLSDAKAAFDSNIANARQAVEKLSEDIAETSAEVTAVVATSRDLANQQQNAFATAQTDRQEAFAKLLAEARAENSAALETLEANVEAETKSAHTALADDLKAATAARARVEEILDIVAETALIGSYSKIAGEEKSAADLWRWITVVAVVGTVLVGGWLVISASDNGTDWDLFLAKLAIAVPIAGVAAYAARQSSEHRHTQRESQHVALQLAALKPYLNDLEKPDERDQLLAEVGRRLFGHPRRDGKHDDSLLDLAADNPSLLAQLAPFLQQLQKGK
jgi:hypothetical protein